MLVQEVRRYHASAPTLGLGFGGRKTSPLPDEFEENRARLSAFYAKHNASKLETVDAVLMKYRGIGEGRTIYLLHSESAIQMNEDCDLIELRNQAMREGMHTLRLSGAQKVAQGLTTIEEVMRVAPPAEMKF